MNLPTLTLGNSYSRIEGLSVTDFKALREELSYEVDNGGYFTGSPHSSKRYLLDKRGEFPSGLLERVAEFLTEYEIVDPRIRPRASAIRPRLKASWGMEPRQEQLEAVYEALEMRRGTIQAVTGAGKSVMIALLAEALGLRTLIVVPNLGLKRQLTESFSQWFESMDHITIENIDSPNLRKDGNYDVLIIDESHHAAAKTYRDLNKKMWKGIYYRFCFTATPYRSKDEEQMLMEGITGQVIYSLDYHKAVSKGYVVPVDAFYVDLPQVEVQGHTWAEVYKELVVDHNARNEMLAMMIKSFSEIGASILCLVKEVRHGQLLSALTQGGFAHAEAEECPQLIKWFSEGRLKALVATMGVCGEGVDTKACEVVIISGLGKSRNQFMQAVGRALRPYPGKTSAKVLLIRDGSHRFTRSHFNAQVKILKQEFGVTPLKLNIT